MYFDTNVFIERMIPIQHAIWEHQGKWLDDLLMDYFVEKMNLDFRVSFERVFDLVKDELENKLVW